MKLKSLLVASTMALTLTLNTSTIMAQDASPNTSSNLAKGQTFLKENATKPGVHTTPSGLQYKVVTEGHGKSPKATQSSSTTAAPRSMALSSIAPTSGMSPSPSL